MNDKIMVAGKMASGKTHVSDFLINKYGYKRISLAGPVKEIEEVVERLGFTHDDLSHQIWKILGEGHVIDNGQFWNLVGILKAELPKIPLDDAKARKRLQWIGTDLGRKLIDPDIWIKLAIDKINMYPTIKWVCDDIRFPNEYEEFSKAGFTGIKLVVSPEVQHERLRILYDMRESEIAERLLHDSEALVDTIPVPAEYCINADAPLMKMFTEIEKKLGFK